MTIYYQICWKISKFLWQEYNLFSLSCATKYSSFDTRCSLFFLWQEVYFHILSFTVKMYCGTSCCSLVLSQETNFLSQEIFLLSQEKILLWQISYSFGTGVILPVTGSFSCDMGLSSHVTGNVLPIKRSTVCVTLLIFSGTGRIFHFPPSQEMFSCETK